MNKYQEIYESPTKKLRKSELDNYLNDTSSLSNWENAYWVAKILMDGDYGVSDEKIIEIFESCFFMGLSSGDGEFYLDVNENLAKLYIRYGQYGKATASLYKLENVNAEKSPDWLHLDFALVQLHTNSFFRDVEDPHFLFNRLSRVDWGNPNTKQQAQNIFSKFLCLIIENGIDSKKVASEEIVHFAEKLGMTDCDEFNLFHQTICPDLPVSAAKTDIEEQTINTEQLEANKAELEELRKKAQLAAQKAAKLESEMKKVKANQQAVQKAKKLEKDLLEVKKKEKETQELLLEKDKEMGALKTKNRELIKNADRHAREKAEMLARQPQGVDYIEVSISQFMNTGLRIHLAGWLEAKFSQICGTNYWNKKIKAVLTADEKENFSLKTELTDFSIDALFNIYYRNLRDFYDYC